MRSVLYSGAARLLPLPAYGCWSKPAVKCHMVTDISHSSRARTPGLHSSHKLLDSRAPALNLSSEQKRIYYGHYSPFPQPGPKLSASPASPPRANRCARDTTSNISPCLCVRCSTAVPACACHLPGPSIPTGAANLPASIVHGPCDTHEFMEMRDGVDFEQKIFVKQHAADLLRQELRLVKPG